MSRTVSINTPGGNSNTVIDKFPDTCGICHKNVDPIYVGGKYKGNVNTSLILEAAFQCTNGDCNSLIIGYYSRKTNMGNFELNKYAPIIPESKGFNDEILEVSSNFIVIYNQSYFAEQSGLHLISGIGYRKAIEFLIKDYLIYLDPDKEEKIVTMPLGQCIDKLDNQQIKDIAKITTWIGNDEAHYTRKWEDKDIEDLKKLIEVTVHFISMDIISKKYLGEMMPK
jgi:hypothetical protein